MLPTLTTRPVPATRVQRATSRRRDALPRWWAPFAAIALLLMLLAPAARAEDFIPPEQAFRYSTSMQGGVVTVRWTVAKGYYLYRKRLGFESSAGWAKLGEPAYPKGEPHTDEYFGTQEVYRGEFAVTLPVAVADPAQAAATLPLTLKLQGCADAGLCYPPTKWNTEVKYAGGAADAASAGPGAGTVSGLLGAAERREAGGALPGLLRGGDASATSAASDPVLAASPAASPVGAAASGGDEFLAPEVAFRVAAFADGPDRVRLEFQIEPGYYLYRSRLKVGTDSGAAQLGALALPEGKTKVDEYFGEQQVYYHTLTATVPVSRNGATALDLPLAVGFQGCADAGLCYPPETRKLRVELPAGSGVATAGTAPGGATAGAEGAFVSEQDRLAETLRSGNLLVVLGLFFVAGLLLAFTPCVLPMVPILSGIIAGDGGQGAGSTRRAFLLSLTYVLGMSITYTAAGIAAAAAGKQVQAMFQQPWIIALFALLFVVLALSMFGLFTIQMPSAIQTRLSDVSNRQRAGTYGGVAAMGALSSLIVTACVAPPLFAALAVIGQTGDLLRGGLALFVMSLGMGAPLMVIGTSAGHLIPRAGAWMDTVKKFFGVLMLGVAAWMLARIVPERLGLALWAVPAAVGAWLLWTEVRGRTAGALAVRVAGVLLGAWGVALLAGAALGGTDPLRPLPMMAGAEHRGLEFRRIASVRELDAEVAAARSAGKAVMLDFYADWCVSCKEMEKYTFTEQAVAAALGDAVLLQADVTANSEDDQALLKRFGIFGPPTIAFYGPDGAERSNYRVVGFMKAEEFARVASAAVGAGTVAVAGAGSGTGAGG